MECYVHKVNVFIDGKTNIKFSYMAVANAPVPVTADLNIKVLVNLKLQPRRHTDTLIFTSIHLMYLMIHFLCRKLKKKVFEKCFKI